MKPSPFAHASDQTIREGDFIRTRSTEDQAEADKKALARERMGKLLPHLHHRTLTVQQQQEQQRLAASARREELLKHREMRSNSEVADNNEASGHTDEFVESPHEVAEGHRISHKRVSILDTSANTAEESYAQSASQPTSPLLLRHRPSSSTASSPSHHNTATSNKRLSTSTGQASNERFSAAIYANGGSSTASRLGIDMSSMESCWGTLTEGTWLSSKRRPIYVGSVLAVNIAEQTVLISVWKKDDHLFTQEKRPLRAVPFSEFVKITPNEFNDICKKKYLRQSAQQSLMGQDHMDGATPFALLEFNNRVVADILDRSKIFATPTTSSSKEKLNQTSHSEARKQRKGVGSGQDQYPSHLPPRPHSMLDRAMGGVGVGLGGLFGSKTTEGGSRAATPLGLRTGEECDFPIEDIAERNNTDASLPRRFIDRSSRNLKALVRHNSPAEKEQGEGDADNEVEITVPSMISGDSPTVVSLEGRRAQSPAKSVLSQSSVPNSRPPTRAQLLSRGIIPAVAVTTIKGKRVGENLFVNSGHHNRGNLSSLNSTLLGTSVQSGQGSAATASDPRIGLVLRRLARAHQQEVIEKTYEGVDIGKMDRDHQHSYYTTKASTNKFLPDANPKNSNYSLLANQKSGPNSVMKTGLSGQFITRGRGAILNDPIPVVRPVHDQLEMVRPLTTELRQAGIKIKSAPRTPFYELEAERLASQLVANHESSLAQRGKMDDVQRKPLHNKQNLNVSTSTVNTASATGNAKSQQDRAREGRPLSSVIMSDGPTEESIDDSVVASVSGASYFGSLAGAAKNGAGNKKKGEATNYGVEAPPTISLYDPAASTSHVTTPRTFLMGQAVSSPTSSRAPTPQQQHRSNEQLATSNFVPTLPAPVMSMFALDPSAIAAESSFGDFSNNEGSTRRQQKGKRGANNKYLSSGSPATLGGSVNNGSKSPMAKALEASRREADVYINGKERDGAAHQRQLLGLLSDPSDYADDGAGVPTEVISLPNIPSEIQLRRSYSSSSGGALGGTTGSLRSGGGANSPPGGSSYHSLARLRGKSSVSLLAAATPHEFRGGKYGPHQGIPWAEAQGDPVAFQVSHFGRRRRNSKWAVASPNTSTTAQKAALQSTTQQTIDGALVTQWWWSGKPTAILQSASLYPIFGPFRQFFQRVGGYAAGVGSPSRHTAATSADVFASRNSNDALAVVGDKDDGFVDSFQSSNSSEGGGGGPTGLTHTYAARDFAPKNRRSTLGPAPGENNTFVHETAPANKLTESPQDHPHGPLNAKRVDSSNESSPISTTPNSRPPSGHPGARTSVMPPKRRVGSAGNRNQPMPIPLDDEEVKPLTRFAGIIKEGELPAAPSPTTVNILVSSATASASMAIPSPKQQPQQQRQQQQQQQPAKIELFEAATANAPSPNPERESKGKVLRAPKFMVLSTDREDFGVSGMPCVLKAVVASSAAEAALEHFAGAFGPTQPPAFAASTQLASSYLGASTTTATSQHATYGRFAELGSTPMFLMQFKEPSQSSLAHNEGNDKSVSKDAAHEAMAHRDDDAERSDDDSFGDHLTPRQLSTREKSSSRMGKASSAGAPPPLGHRSVNTHTSPSTRLALSPSPLLPLVLAFVSLWQPPPPTNASPMTARGRVNSLHQLNRGTTLSTTSYQSVPTTVAPTTTTTSTPHDQSILENSGSTDDGGPVAAGTSATTNPTFAPTAAYGIGRAMAGSVPGANASLSTSPQAVAISTINERWSAVVAKFSGLPTVNTNNNPSNESSQLRAVSVGAADAPTGLPQAIIVSDGSLEQLVSMHAEYQQQLLEHTKAVAAALAEAKSTLNNSGSVNNNRSRSISSQSFKEMRIAIQQQKVLSQSGSQKGSGETTAEQLLVSLKRKSTAPSLPPPTLPCPPVLPPHLYLTLQEALVSEGLAWVVLPGTVLTALEALREWSQLVAKLKGKKKASPESGPTHRRRKVVAINSSTSETATAIIGKPKKSATTTAFEGVGDAILSDEDNDADNKEFSQLLEESFSFGRSSKTTSATAISTAATPSAYTAAAAAALTSALAALGSDEARLFYTYGHFLNSLIACQQVAMRSKVGMWDPRYGIGALVQHHTHLSAVVSEAKQSQKQNQLSVGSGAVSSVPSLLMRTRSSLGAAAALARTSSISVGGLSGGPQTLMTSQHHSSFAAATHTMSFSRRQSIGNFASINPNSSSSAATTQAVNAAVAAAAQMAAAVTTSLYTSSALPTTAAATPTPSYGGNTDRSNVSPIQQQRARALSTQPQSSYASSPTAPEEGRPMGALFDLWESTQAALKSA